MNFEEQCGVTGLRLLPSDEQDRLGITAITSAIFCFSSAISCSLWWIWPGRDEGNKDVHMTGLRAEQGDICSEVPQKIKSATALGPLFLEGGKASPSYIEVGRGDSFHLCFSCYDRSKMSLSSWVIASVFWKLQFTDALSPPSVRDTRFESVSHVFTKQQSNRDSPEQLLWYQHYKRNTKHATLLLSVIAHIA